MQTSPRDFEITYLVVVPWLGFLGMKNTHGWGERAMCCNIHITNVIPMSRNIQPPLEHF